MTQTPMPFVNYPVMKNVRTILNNKTYVSIALLSILSFFMVGFRVVYTQSPFYKFMIWNLFLALIPLIVSSIILHYKQKSLKVLIIPILFWLLFFPNAPYLITDIVHHSGNSRILFWYDFLVLTIFALLGLFITVESLRHIHQVLLERMNKKASWALISFIIFISSVGIYIGRVLRWNSWDAFVNPYGVVITILYRIAHPQTYPDVYFMTIGLSVLIFASYLFYSGKK
ncbi:MAG TPA: DUF1361 domain-containing protein [Candidatus Dojkabacteria bacterium]